MKKDFHCPVGFQEEKVFKTSLQQAPEALPAPAGNLQPSLTSLDGIRGLAALVIAAGHFFLCFSPHRSVSLPNGAGSSQAVALPIDFFTQVTLFIIASGFLFGVLYQEPPALLPFLKRRLARVGPMYYAALALNAIPFLSIYSQRSIERGVPISLLGLQSVAILDGNDWVPPLWTVSAFVGCYAVMPAMLRAVLPWRSSSLKLAVAAASLLSAALATLYMEVGGPSKGWELHVLVYYRLPQFFAGLCTGVLARRAAGAADGRKRGGSSTLLAEAMSLLLAALFLAIPLLCFQEGRDIPFQHRLMFYAEFLILPVHCAWLYALSQPDCGGLTRAVLSSRPVQWLGEISYSIYCLHWPLMVWAVWAVQGWGTPLQHGLLPYFPAWAVLPLLGMVVAVSAVAHSWLEQPARAKLKGLGEEGGRGGHGAGQAREEAVAGKKET